MCIVALAMCEYAALLTIRYGNLKGIGIKGDTDKTTREKRCRKIDQRAMIFFTALNTLTIGGYFYYYY